MGCAMRWTQVQVYSLSLCGMLVFYLFSERSESSYPNFPEAVQGFKVTTHVKHHHKVCHCGPPDYISHLILCDLFSHSSPQWQTQKKVPFFACLFTGYFLYLGCSTQLPSWRNWVFHSELVLLPKRGSTLCPHFILEKESSQRKCKRTPELKKYFFKEGIWKCGWIKRWGSFQA